MGEMESAGTLSSEATALVSMVGAASEPLLVSSSWRVNANDAIVCSARPESSWRCDEAVTVHPGSLVQMSFCSAVAIWGAVTPAGSGVLTSEVCVMPTWSESECGGEV